MRAGARAHAQSGRAGDYATAGPLMEESAPAGLAGLTELERGCPTRRPRSILAPMIEVDPDRTVFELTEAHPALIDVLSGLGFAGVRNPGTRATMGRIITLRKGCRLQGRTLGDVSAVFAAAGFKVAETAAPSV